MEKNLKNRYKNADRFTDDLNNFLDKKPISANELNFVRECQRLFRRHKKACIVGATFVTIFITMIVVWGWHINQKNVKLEEKDKENNILLMQNHCYIGLVYEEKQNYSDALLEYEEAIKIMKAKNIPYAKVYSDRASLFTEAPDYLHQIRKEKKDYLTYQQEQDFEEAIKIDPHYAKVFYNMGKFYEKKEDIRKAMEHYAKVVECDFDLSKTYQTDKETELSKGKTQKEHNKTMFKAYFNRGNILYKQKKFTEAIADYTKAIKYNSTHYEIYFNRYSSYNILGEHDKAQQDFAMYEKLKLKK